MEQREASDPYRALDAPSRSRSWNSAAAAAMPRTGRILGRVGELLVFFFGLAAGVAIALLYIFAAWGVPWAT